MRLPHGTSLLVDTGAPGNLAGSEWTQDHARELWAADQSAPRYTKRETPLPCSGVGTGKQVATHDVEVPIALGNGRLDGYRAAELPDSKTPALLGRNAMKAKRVLLDTFTGKFFMVGPGGYELKLSPGSEVYETEDSKAGHMMLPCSQFANASRQQNRDAQTFLVGEYFAPKETSAALQRLPVSATDWERYFNDTAGHEASS